MKVARYYRLYTTNEETGSEKLSNMLITCTVCSKDFFCLLLYTSVRYCLASFWKPLLVSYLYLSVWYFFSYFSFSKLFRHNYGHKSCGPVAPGSRVSISEVEASVLSSLDPGIPTPFPFFQYSLKCAGRELDC